MTDSYFNIQIVIDLVKQQEPDRVDLVLDLENQSRKKWIRQAYVKFVNSENANQEGAEWQIDTNIVLEDDSEGTIVLDVLKGGRVGGIEFLKYIP